MPKALPPIPTRDQLHASKTLSIKPLLQVVRKTFSKIPDHRTGLVEYSLVDTLMSASAVFGLKFPSLLKFDENRQEAHIKHNLGTLYGVEGQIPCDTQMRTILDPVEPAEVSRGFNALHRTLEHEGVLESFKYLGAVENETFNTLKNQGYNLEHNYGHGKKHLSTVLGMLMMLMFLIDQIQEASCKLFQAARNRFHSRTSVWNRLRGYFANYFIESWDDIWLSMIYGNQRGALIPNTS